MQLLKAHYALPIIFVIGMILSMPCYSNQISKFEIRGDYIGDLATGDLELVNGDIIFSNGIFDENSSYKVEVGYTIGLPWNSFPINILSETPAYDVELPFISFYYGICPNCASRPYQWFKMKTASPYEYYSNPHPAINDYIRQSGNGIIDAYYVPPSYKPLPVSWELYAFEKFGLEDNKFILTVTHAVPEQTTISLMLIGLFSLLFLRLYSKQSVK